jgi:cysteine-rich repeat protein
MGILRAVACGVLVVAACSLPPSTQRNLNDEAVCGDGVIGKGEVCDDGNTVDGDGCSADCKSDETCGNGILDVAAGELCDDGNTLGGDGCGEDCKSDESCGNGIVDKASGETCDDGNLISGDGCSKNCQSNETCGNNIVDVNEQCDSGNQFTATCDPDCTFAMCGDGVKNAAAGEQCDDGNNIDTDGCARCKIAKCGDGFKHTGVEQCDDGNTNNNDACTNNCTTARCGDGIVRTGVEQCDDANSNNHDGCLNTCVRATCGDGFVRFGVEDCDDGNTNSGDGCDSTCHWEAVTYVVTDQAKLIGMAQECNDGTDPFNACDGTPVGFSWDDNTPFDPSSIVVEINHGVDCDGPHTEFAHLNNVDTNQVPFDSPNGCSCTPEEQLVSWTITDVSSFQRGATNAVTLEGSVNCQGFGDDIIGGYARVTVYP